MSVKTTVFGGVRLTGTDAQAFRKQIAEQPVKQEAKDALLQGRRMRQEFQEKGFVKLALK